MVTEAHEAERYSRRFGERITDGYAAKFNRYADQGGHAPLGFRRVPLTFVLAIDPEGNSRQSGYWRARQELDTR
jgi:hypothetical protein